MFIPLIKFFAYGILSNLICILGLLGNTLTLYIMNASKGMLPITYTRKKKKQTNKTKELLSLNFIDLILLLCGNQSLT